MKIMFDVGHGGGDPGAVANGLRESECNLAVAKATRAHLLKLLPNAQAHLSREDNRQLVAQQRVKVVRDFAPDICISIHHNSATATAEGAEVFYANGDGRGRELAELIGMALQSIGRSWRGAKTRLSSSGRDYYYMIRDINNSKTVALLCEGAFLTNASEAAWLESGGIEQQGMAIAEAVAEYLRRMQPVQEPQLPPMPKSIVPTLVYDEMTSAVYHAYVIDGTTYVPVRAIAESAGRFVQWDAKTNKTTLKKK